MEAENAEVKKDLWNLRRKHEGLEEELSAMEGQVAEGRRILDDHVAAAGRERAELVREVHGGVGELRKEARALQVEIGGGRSPRIHFLTCVSTHTPGRDPWGEKPSNPLSHLRFPHFL